MKIVLVHGIFNTGRVMSRMQKIFEAEGHECFAPTLAPFDGSLGIEHASTSLKQQIELRFGEHEMITLVGFSMGGIVARYYLQALGGAKRVANLFTLSSPHHGTYTAYLPYPSKTFKQLRPNSELLHFLQEGEESLEGVNLFSYWTAIDYTIVPSSSSLWPWAKNKRFFIILHLSVIFSRKITDEIIAELRGAVA